MFANLLGGNIEVVILFLMLTSLPISWRISVWIKQAFLKSVKSHQKQVSSHPEWSFSAVSGSAVADNLPSPQARRSIHVQTQKEKSVLLAYAIAGGLQALYAAIIQIAVYQSSFSVFRIMALFGVFAWPILLTYWQLTSAPIRTKYLMSVAYFCFLLGLGIVLGTGAFGLIFLWGGLMGGPSLILWGLSRRALQSIGHFVFPLVLLFLFGMNLVMSVLGLAWGGILTLIICLILVSGVVTVSRKGVQHIIEQYITQQYSDRMLLIDSWWLAFSLWDLCLFVAYSDSVGTLTGYLGLLSFFVYYLCLRLGLKKNIHSGSLNSPLRLLWLRVFDRQQESTELLDCLGNKWRTIGNIQMIAGVDLAGNFLEPDQLLAYLRGQLAQQFIRSPEQFFRQLRSIDLTPDLDGRYRMSQFFCLNTNWQYVFHHLLPVSHTVLIDLRGFDAAKTGIQHELTTVLESLPARGFVILVDASISEAQYKVLQDKWHQVSPRSPNFNRPFSELQVVQYRPDKIQDVFECLCRSVEANGLSYQP